MKTRRISDSWADGVLEFRLDEEREYLTVSVITDEGTASLTFDAYDALDILAVANILIPNMEDPFDPKEEEA